MENPELLRLLEEFGHRWFRSAENRRFDLAVSYLIRASEIRGDGEAVSNGKAEPEQDCSVSVHMGGNEE